MAEILRKWLRIRLGVIIDLSPDVFARYARDGTILAKILHSYDIINDEQLRTLNRTQDPALSRVNLRSLRIWLRFINVECDDECIEEISNCRGTSALRLFYKVFLSLENKDSLHFVTLQKEREKFVPNSSKFEVTTVSEEPLPRVEEDHPLSKHLGMRRSLRDWAKRKNSVFTGLKKEESQSVTLEDNGSEMWSPSALQTLRSVPEEAERKELDDFARKHRVKEIEPLLEACEEIPELEETAKVSPKADPEAASAFVKSLKRKYRQEARAKDFKKKMQTALVTQVFEKIVTEQEMELDELIARRVLDQSQYEKKMMRKLSDVRSEKLRMAKNRQLVEELSQRTREKEARLEEDRARDLFLREGEVFEAERKRMKELERRIDEDTAKKKLQKLRKLGEEAVNDLVDLSSKAAEFLMASEEDSIPKVLWNQWKTLFINSKPIPATSEEFLLFEDAEGELEGEEVEKDAEEIDTESLEILNTKDFYDYHNLKSPWDEFLPKEDTERDEILNLGLGVLGYIVHRVLRSVHSPRKGSFCPPLPKLKVRGILHGLPDVVLHEPLRELLEHSKIHLITVEEAINHCLIKYKEEMKDHEFIDLKIISATREALKKQASGAADESKKKSPKKEKLSPSNEPKISSSKKKFNLQGSGVDKVTQTPRKIPFEDSDPVLSDAAYIGKWTHEFLTLGQPISDDLSARILLEYLRGFEEPRGFVFVDYPVDYKQMAALELTFNGRRLPEGSKYSSNEEEEGNIEDIEAPPSRIEFEKEETDSEDVSRESRLVPCFRDSLEASDGRSYFSVFVKVDSTPKELDRESDYEFVEDSGSLEAFWAEEGIGYIFYYKLFNMETLKKLVRILVGGGSELKMIDSVELFGEGIDYIEEPKDDDYSVQKRAVIKKLLVRRESVSSLGESEDYEMSERSYGTEIEVSRSERKKYRKESEEMRREYDKRKKSGEETPEEDKKSAKSVKKRRKEEEKRRNSAEDDKKRTKMITEAPKEDALRPGEVGWSFANLPQSLDFVLTLAKLWRSLESSYIENLKNVFELKRRSFEAIVPYANFVRKHMKEFVRRPDTKQDLLHEFHRAFNQIDDDIREDTATKRELHCRVADFEVRLWDVCNERRKEAEEERRRIISEHWTTREAIVTFNAYVGILQAELDRFVDSLQFVQDYYQSMLQRPIRRLVDSRIALKTIEIEFGAFDLELHSSAAKKSSSRSLSEDKLDISSGKKSSKSLQEAKLEISSGKKSAKSLKDVDSREAKAKTSTLRISSIPRAPDQSVLELEVAQLLTDPQEEISETSRMILSKGFEDNFRFVESVVESIASDVLEVLKREEIAVSKPEETKGKKSSRRASRTSGGLEEVELKKRLRELVLEWRYALNFEINRVRMRLKLLEEAARVDVGYLVESMQRLFFEILRLIVDRYENELSSVNSMASTFRFAIEEATPIQQELLLDGDRFLVRSDVLMYPDTLRASPRPPREEESKTVFKMSQLSNLLDIFRRVAPSGTLPERSFVYILQDLIACSDLETGSPPLPASWLQLRACDVPRLVALVFGDAGFVDWREFIVRAMEIDLPTVDQLLDALDSFENLDEDKNGTLTCHQLRYSRGLWFLPEINHFFGLSSPFLHEEDEKDDSEEEEIAGGSHFFHKEESRYFSDESLATRERNLRMNLAADLLCDLFSCPLRTVEYKELLLAFCKSEEAKEGLGKALSVVMGSKICMDWEEGERYVREIKERRVKALEDEAQGRYLQEEAVEASKSVLSLVLKGVVTRSESEVNIETIAVSSVTKLDVEEANRVPIRIEVLDDGEEIVDLENIPRIKKDILISSNEEVEEVTSSEDMESGGPSVCTIDRKGSEGWEKSQRSERATVYRLNVEVCQTALASLLPRLATEADLFGSGKTLRENIQFVCKELEREEDEEANENTGEILAHRFLESDFVQRLLAETSRFASRNLGDLVEKINSEWK